MAFFPALSIALAIVHCPAPLAFPLHTEANHVFDSSGRRIHINAVNWYGAESPDFVVGGLGSATPYAIAQLIKQLGFNAVRLPWSNQLVESNPIAGTYALTANPQMQGLTAMQIFDQVVSALTEQELMVILDNHNSDAEWCCGDDGNTLWENSSYPEENWIADWQNMAQRYANQPYVIGADLRNEPRINATWGGSPSTDWHAAAERGGNAVLAVNPTLLVFVEGVNYATDLSGAATLPVNLTLSDRLVYSAHDYGFDYSGLSKSTDWIEQIEPRWGFLVDGPAPQPFWLGEFGTCNTSDSCVTNIWFQSISTYLSQNHVDWSYWPINGTESTGVSRTFGAAETYGVLATNWRESALPILTSTLQELQSHAFIPEGRQSSCSAPR
jgi:endoglucanase